MGAEEIPENIRARYAGDEKPDMGEEVDPREERQLLEARVMDLEDALDQAANTIGFLHGCLTDDHYSYAYPEQTIRELEHIRELVPERPTCIHSTMHNHPDCPSCVMHIKRIAARAALALALGTEEEG